MKVQANGIADRSRGHGRRGPARGAAHHGPGHAAGRLAGRLRTGLVDAGFRVVRFDNRDIGLSAGLRPRWACRNLVWQGHSPPLRPAGASAYTLQDMANDAIGVLDALGIRRAHVVGASMGGMIAQRVAASARARAASLVSIMSSSGARGLPGPRRDVTAADARRPGKSETAGGAQHQAPAAHPEPVLSQTGRRWLRTAHPRHAPRLPAPGLMRQMPPSAADTGRAKLLARITSPTLVMHGERRSAGAHRLRQDTAAAFPARSSSPFPAWATTCRPAHRNPAAADRSFPDGGGKARPRRTSR
jgi:pimeloyl-ACP methyl ester carboxylesterase